MQTYLINLDRSPERLAHMSALLGAMDVPFERISACDGALLPEPVLPTAGSDLSRGEIGCLISHRTAWQAIAAGSEPYGAVFEDDIHLSPDLSRFLSGITWIPDDADIVTLEAGHRPVSLAKSPARRHEGRAICELVSTHSGAAGYILSARAAGKLLLLAAELDSPADAVLFDLPRGGDRAHRVYQVTPALCIQDSFLPKQQQDHRLASTLQADRKKARRSMTGIIERLVREVRYPIQKFALHTVPKLLPGSRSAHWTTVRYATAVDAPVD